MHSQAIREMQIVASSFFFVSFRVFQRTGRVVLSIHIGFYLLF